MPIAPDKVFIASRFQEFDALRATLRRRIAEVGYEVVDLNDGTSASMTTRDRSLAEIAASDFVIVLLGTTYHESADPEFISITHDEVRTAYKEELHVLAYRVPGSGSDPRVAALAHEIEEHTTIGALSGGSDTADVLDDAELVINDLLSHSQSLDKSEVGDGPASFTNQLDRDLDYLGLSGLRDWQVPQHALLGNPQYARLVEHRRLALRALEARDRKEVRRQLTDAHGVYPYDWCTNFLLARMLEARGRNTDLADAASVVEQAVRALDQSDHLTWGPVSLASAQDAHDRRLAATLDLAARIARLRRDYRGALQAATASRDLNRHGLNALQEIVRANAQLGEPDAAGNAADDLLALYPYSAQNLMRDPDLAPLQPALEQRLIGTIRQRHRQAAQALGVTTSIPEPRRLRDALANFREFAADHRGAVAATVTTCHEMLDANKRMDEYVQGQHQAAIRRQSALRQENAIALARWTTRLAEMRAEEYVDPRSKAEPDQAPGDIFTIDRRLKTQQKCATLAATLAKVLLTLGILGFITIFGFLGAMLLMGAAFFAVVALTDDENMGLGAMAAAAVGGLDWYVTHALPSPPLWVWGTPGAVFILLTLIARLATSRTKAHLATACTAAEGAWEQDRGSRIAQLEAEIADVKQQHANAEQSALYCPDEDEAVAGFQAAIAQVRVQLDKRAATLAVPTEERASAALARTLMSSHIRRFNAAFAANPSWGFEGYVPVRRATSGDLTRLEADDNGVPDPGVGSGPKSRRLVVKTDRSYSHLRVFFLPSAPELGCEQEITRLVPTLNQPTVAATPSGGNRPTVAAIPRGEEPSLFSADPLATSQVPH